MAATRRLRDTMREDLALRGMSANTIESYVRCARRFAEHFGRSPCRMGAAEIRTFLLSLVDERGLSASTFNVHAAALKFLYTVTLDRPEAIARMPRMRVPMHMPVVLSGTEVERLLGAIVSERHRVAAMLAFGAGLRVGEICNLLVEDVDPKRMVLRIRGSKRGRERYVMLSPRLLSAMRAYWKVAWASPDQLDKIVRAMTRRLRDGHHPGGATRHQREGAATVRRDVTVQPARARRASCPCRSGPEGDRGPSGSCPLTRGARRSSFPSDPWLRGSARPGGGDFQGRAPRVAATGACRRLPSSSSVPARKRSR
jgi:integrase